MKISNRKVYMKSVYLTEKSTLSVLKFAQYYFSRTARCANLSTARIFVRAKRSKIKNANQQIHRDIRLGSSRNCYFFGNRRSPETRGSVYDATNWTRVNFMMLNSSYFWQDISTTVGNQIVSLIFLFFLHI